MTIVTLIKTVDINTIGEGEAEKKKKKGVSSQWQNEKITGKF